MFLAIAQNLTGVTTEQVDAYKRSLSAPWDSRAAILPINKWKDGKKVKPLTFHILVRMMS